MKNRTLFFIIAIVVIAAVVGGVYLISAGNSVGSVGGEKITKAEYKFVLNNYKMQIEGYQQFENESQRKEFWNSKIDGNETAEALVRKNTIDFLKEMKIQIALAKQNNISLDKGDLQDVKDYINQMVEQQYGGKRRDAEQGTKEAYGITLSQFEQIYRNLLLAQKFSANEMEKVNPDDAAVKKYYDENVNDFDQVTVTHVLFSTVDDNRNPLPEDKQQEAKKKADELFATVKPSDDFKALAQKHSQDPGVADNKGEYTFTYAESYAPEFKDWAFKAKVGEIGLVKTDFGYHIMKLEKKTTFADIDPETIKAAIRSGDFQNKLEEWKKDAKYNVITNQKAINSIKIV